MTKGTLSWFVAFALSFAGFVVSLSNLVHHQGDGWAWGIIGFSILLAGLLICFVVWVTRVTMEYRNDVTHRVWFSLDLNVPQGSDVLDYASEVMSGKAMERGEAVHGLILEQVDSPVPLLEPWWTKLLPFRRCRRERITLKQMFGGA